MGALPIVNKILSLLTVFSQIFLFLSLTYLIFSPSSGRRRFFTFISRHIWPLALTIVLVAVLGSLFYSEIAAYPPCELCWYQRIFMYPQIFLLAWAWYRQDRRIIDYLLILSIVGGAIALYHNYLYFGSSALAACVSGTSGALCLARYVFEFSYITIPVMSLTAFLILIFLFFTAKKAD